MESKPITTDKSDLSLPPLPAHSPESRLVGLRIIEMSEEQLTAHIIKLRAARESPQITRALLSAKPKAVKKVDLSFLDL
jgi:hypothetical protein